jgi:hypothetical protein
MQGGVERLEISQRERELDIGDEGSEKVRRGKMMDTRISQTAN